MILNFVISKFIYSYLILVYLFVLARNKKIEDYKSQNKDNDNLKEIESTEDFYKTTNIDVRFYFIAFFKIISEYIKNRLKIVRR